jgi:hypothetical protein
MPQIRRRVALQERLVFRMWGVDVRRETVYRRGSLKS